MDRPTDELKLARAKVDAEEVMICPILKINNSMRSLKAVCKFLKTSKRPRVILKT